MNSIEWTPQLRFAVALALGFLVGLERESAKIERKTMVFGGVRTHPMIAMFGFGCAWLSQIGVAFMLPAGLAAMIALTSVAYIAKIRAERFGTTTEFSAILTFVTGALALLVDIWAAMAVGVLNTILLSEKASLETWVERLDRAEFLATLRFLLVTLIILPVLPDQSYTPYQLNPTHIWQIVILVSTIGFVGYILSKRFGERAGLWVSGILGGVVSSTAVTVAVGRAAQAAPGRGRSALQAALLASSVMYFRILVLIAVIGPQLVPHLWWKCAILAGSGVVLALLTPPRDGAEDVHPAPPLHNPFEITPALLFAALFVVLMVVTSVVRETLGNSGLIALGAIVGVSDIDPFILSLARPGDTAPGVAVS
ncbi:MAG TPA: MgtC/SapB family protein, partial [Bacteroidota bacterium]|nr:MgtC/SapB family protein [Bacteroidota bacterium]